MVRRDDIRKADEGLRDFSGKAFRSACYAPFVSLFFTTAGNVLACCRKEDALILGNVRNQSLTDIWKGRKIAALRQALTDYKFHLGCQFCEWEIGGGSNHTAVRAFYEPFPILSTEPDWPAVIDFEGSNTCNFECVMCSGELSSSIRANREGLPPLPKAYGDQFFDDLRPFLPHLRWMNFLGGEPFLTTEAHRIWQMMIDDGLAVPCHVTTNGSQCGAKVERVLNALPIHITVSLDGTTRETFESIRRRSDFETVVTNLHRFRAYTQQRGTSFSITFCLMRQNWKEFSEVLLLGDQLDCDVLVNTVIGPSHCSLFTLPSPELRAVVGQMETQYASAADLLRRNQRVWEESLQKLRTATDLAQTRKLEVVLRSSLLRDNPLLAAQKAAEKGNYDLALQKLHGIPHGHADHYGALALSGYIRSLQGDLAGAERDLEQALRVSRKLPAAYLNLARIRFRQGRMRDAHEIAQKARDLAIPEDSAEVEALVLLAFIQTRRGRIAQAYRVLTRLASLPANSREGENVPESRAGARRSLVEIASDPHSMLSKTLAAVVQALYLLARHWLRLTRGRTTSGTASPPRSAEDSDNRVRTLLSKGQPACWNQPKWSIRVAGVNKAGLVVPAGDHESVRVAIEQVGTAVPHDVQLNYAGVKLLQNHVYRLSFRIRADQPRTVGFGVAKATVPWSNLGIYRVIEVTTAWKNVRDEFVAAIGEENARVHFDLGGSGTSVEVTSFALTECSAECSASVGAMTSPATVDQERTRERSERESLWSSH